MKPLARWTIGPVTKSGQEILRESVSKFARVYPEFERIICYNNLDPSILSDLTNQATLHEQREETVPCLLSKPDDNVEEATGCGWKLAPPRLHINGMELFIDNDIVIRERIPQIDEWLIRGDCGLITEGLDRKRMFGAFDLFISPEIHANAGLFGLPPYFDFASHISHYSAFLSGGLGGYNEQGLTVATVVNMKNYIMVPLSEMFICEDLSQLPLNLPSGLHFVSANRKNYHRGWKAYKSKTMVSLML